MRRTNLNQTSTAVVFTILMVVILLSIFRALHPQPTAATEDTPEARGKTVFAQHCSGCHFSDSKESKLGPGLAGLFEREELPVSGRPVSEETVRDQLKDPYENMPRVGDDLSEAQIEDVVAYLKTL
ncbi:MAG: c-type cytochrome [Thermodesulfobacteriota bacterium]